MRVVVTQRRKAANAISFTFLLVMVGSAAYAYTCRGTSFMWVGGGLAFLSLFGLVRSTWTESLLLQIDDEGISDRRLGIGKILWSDVSEVKLQATEEHCFLCLSVPNAEPYLARLKGPKLERVLYHRKLGFQSFNIDVGMVQMNLQELKRQIEARIVKSKF